MENVDGFVASEHYGLIAVVSIVVMVFWFLPAGPALFFGPQARDSACGTFHPYQKINTAADYRLSTM